MIDGCINDAIMNGLKEQERDSSLTSSKELRFLKRSSKFSGLFKSLTHLGRNVLGIFCSVELQLGGHILE